MASPQGLSILDLLGLPPGSPHLIPKDILAELDKLSILEFQSTTSPDAHIYHGIVRSLGDAFFPSSLNWPIELPLLNAGVPFQLTRPRKAPTGGQNLEPAPDGFQIDLFLDHVAFVVPGLKPALQIDSAGVTAAHLVRDPFRSQVRIVGSGTLRIASNPDGGTPSIRFVAPSDPFDPKAPTGAVFGLNFEPAHFFFGDSEYGMTVDRLTYDDSEEYTPPEILARGREPAWRGISIKEATAFFPRNVPWLGDVSVGVRDVLLGSPLGMQGEIRIELGSTPVDPVTIGFFQSLATGETPLGGADATDAGRVVKFASGSGGVAQVRAAGPAGSDHNWVLPDGRRTVGPSTPYFQAKTGDVLTVQGYETATDLSPDGTPAVSPAGTPAVSPAVGFRFAEAAADPSAVVPKIDAVIGGTGGTGGTTRANVVHLSGKPEALAGVKFQANPGAADLKWQLGTGSDTGAGEVFAPDFPSAPGSYDLVLTDSKSRTRRVKVEMLADGDLIVGCQAGVFSATGPVSLHSVEGTYDLQSFENGGSLAPFTPAAQLVAGAVTVPTGGLADVALEFGTPTDPSATPPPPPPPEPKRHLQVLMDFDTPHELTWGDEGLVDPFSIAALREWANGFTGAEFVVIGRTCDMGTTARNKALCQERASRGKDLLGSAEVGEDAIDASLVHARGEQHLWTASGDPAGAPKESEIGLAPTETEAAVTVSPHYGWLFRIKFGTFSDVDRDAHGRKGYRRVDIYAVGGTAGADTPDKSSDSDKALSSRRRSLVPGADKTEVVAPKPRDCICPYRVRLVVRWDSPTVQQWSDAIPTQAELTIAWQSTSQALPGAPAATTVTPKLTKPPATGPEIFTFVGQWSYDPRSGQTQFALSLNSAGDPNGLAYVGGSPSSPADNILATMMALGPALLAGISGSDVAGGTARLAALIAACTVASGWAKDGKVVLYGLKLEWRQRVLDSLVGSRQRLLFDYTAQVGFTISAAGISVTASKPIKVRYKNVGVELDNAKEGLDRFGLVYENVSFDIEDPGQWTITGPLGELLRVAGTRAGSGSTWIELDLRFALDLGVVHISGCTLRVTFPTGSSALGVEFRGFRAGVNIPGVLAGEGMLAIGAGGSLRAGIDVNIIPAKVLARAALALEGSFASLEVMLILPVGIPLASSGLGLYGLAGRFVSNGQRQISSTSTDPIQKEIDWYRQSADTKYGPCQGQWALGLGAIIGTMPDAGFTFNAMGMLTVSFPDVSVIFSIDARLFQLPALPKEEGSPPSAGLTLLGIVAIDPSAVKIGVRGRFEIPKVLILEVPFGAYFPISSGLGDPYVRIGADGFEGRTGDPVSLTLLPGTLDRKSWAFMMVESRQLHKLGGIDSFNLDGFSLGFGAGFTMQWGGGSVYLRASAKILAGVGTHPFTVVAAILIEGELRLAVVSISVSGDVQAIFTNDYQVLHGTFCGEVDCFFFSIKGCVDITIGSGDAPGIPTPDHPLTRVDLTDRKGAITGRAILDDTAAEPGAPPATVWPDTVPLLNFSHFAQNCLSGSPFSPMPAELPGQPWSGSSELKYAFRLTNVELNQVGVGPVAGPLDSVWWWPTHRSGVMSAADPAPSEQEARQLALLSWHPAPWARNLSDGGAGTPGDPATTVGLICQPNLKVVRNCALGQDAQRTGMDRVAIPTRTAGTGSLANSFQVLGQEGWPGTTYADFSEALGATGLFIQPGRIRIFSPAVPVPKESSSITGAYELPWVAQSDRFLSTLQFCGRLQPELSSPTLTLAICDQGDRIPIGVKQNDSFKDLQPRIHVEQGMVRDGVTYNWLSGVPANDSPVVDFAPGLQGDGHSELWTGPQGLELLLSEPAGSVEADVCHFNGQPMTMEVFDRWGRMLAAKSTGKTPNKVYTLKIAGVGIHRVVIRGGSVESSNSVSTKTAGVLMRFCRVSDYSSGPLGKTSKLAQPKLPTVTGLTTDGHTVAWKGTKTTLTITSKQCPVVVYHAPNPGPWQSFEIAPFQQGHVALLALCGTRWDAEWIAKQNAEAKADTAFGLSSHSSPTSSERENLLEANAEYEIRVSCQWRAWTKSDDHPAPPPLDDIGWTDFPQQVYRFHTAAEKALPAEPPPFEFKDETELDPRGLNRYLLGFRPDGHGAPHFLDDPLAVDFEVDHLERLMGKYGRGLALKLRRTDPPPASLAGFIRPPDVLLTVVFNPLPTNQLPVADQRLIAAAVKAPCVEPPALGGTTAHATAALDRSAEYDLMLVAPPLGDPKQDAVLVARTHFQTSRYRNPGELLAKLGLRWPDSYPVLPVDAFVITTGLSGTILRSDQDFETSLRTLGLDPWPLPDEPRVVVLWHKETSGAYKLAGILIETDEALDRGDALQVKNALVGSSVLMPRRSNAAGTRWLLLPEVPMALSSDTTFTLILQVGTATLSGKRDLGARPRIFAQEGL
jgi:hypothetical protein